MKEKLIRPIFRFFNSRSKNAEIYINNGSVWLIFTNEKRWVFELTKEGTLWYNYYFFENILKYFSLEVVKNQDYITKWVENFIQNGVNNTFSGVLKDETTVEDTIQNGVKNTITRTARRPRSVEDTIQNGVKDIIPVLLEFSTTVEDTIQNGVKETKHNPFEDGLAMEEAIQNGVKEIKEISDSSLSSEIFKVRRKQTIRDGVKRTTVASSPCWKLVEDVVQNGVKETTPGGYLGSVEMIGKTVHQFESPKQNNEVEDVIENGVKETIPHFLEILNPINFEPVIKEMKRMNEVNIVLEEGIKETKYCELHSLMRADHIIRDGIKETHWKRVDNHPTFIDSIIQTKNPS